MRNATPSARFLMIVGVLLVLGLVTSVWYQRQPAILAQRWAARLDRLPPEKLNAHLRGSSQFGDRQPELLAIAVAHPRSETAAAAIKILGEQFTAWQSGSAQQMSARLMDLASALELRSADVSSSVSQELATLVEQMAAWPTTGIDRRRLLLTCESILERLPGPPQISPNTALDLGLAATAPQPDTKLTVPPRRVAERVVAPAVDEDGFVTVGEAAESERVPQRVAGGDKITIAAIAPDARPAPDQPSVGEPSPRRVAAPVATSLAERTSPRQTTPDGGRPNPQGESVLRRISAARSVWLPTGSQPPTAQLAAAKIDERIERFPGRPEVLKLFDATHRSNSAEAQSARRQLRGMAIPGWYIEIGLRLTHPDPRRRIETARELAPVSHVDTTSWLVWLCHDRSADVRRTAIGLLATRGDPQLTARLVQIALSDPDPGIRALADRLQLDR